MRGWTLPKLALRKSLYRQMQISVVLHTIKGYQCKRGRVVFVDRLVTALKSISERSIYQSKQLTSWQDDATDVWPHPE